MFASVLFAFAACVVAVYAQSSCDNPLVPAAWGWFLPEPVNVQSDLCPTATQSCCPIEHKDDVEHGFDNIKHGLENASQAVHEFISDASINEVIDELTRALDEKLRNAIRDFVKGVFNDVKGFVDSFFSQAFKCISAWVRYSAGYICLLCDANWNKYITVDSSTDTVTINYSNNVCNMVGAPCADVYTKTVDGVVTICESFKKRTVALLNEVLDFYQVPDQQKQSIIDYFNNQKCDRATLQGSNPPCTDSNSCQQLVCDSLKDGETNIINSQWALLAGAFKFSLVTQYANSNGPSKRDENLAKAYATMETVFAAVAKHAADVTAEEQEIDAKLRHMTRAVAASNVDVKYTSSGYDAIDAGDKSSMDTTVSSAPLVAVSAVAALLL